MILSNETNKVYFSAHLKADYPIFFKRIKTVLEQNNIIVDLLQETNDYWCRDYMPIQVNKNRFVIYKYFPDYLNKPTKICYITNVEKTLSYLGIADNQTIDLSDIVIDGGNVVKTPYHVIMTEKIFIENPTISHDKLISRLELAFQSEIIRIVPEATAIAMSVYSGIFNVGIGTGALIGGFVCSQMPISYIGYVGGSIAVVSSVYCAKKLIPLLRR